MTNLRLKYIHQYKDRHGKQRFYFRKRGLKRIPLPGAPGSREFMEAYQAALEERPAIGLSRSKPGTISSLISEYYLSSDWETLKPTTKQTYEGILERFREEHGNKPVRQLEAKHIRNILNQKKTTPTAANRLLT